MMTREVSYTLPSGEIELQSKWIKNITADIPELQLCNYKHWNIRYSIWLKTMICKAHVGRI